jgi:SSS family transporter
MTAHLRPLDLAIVAVYLVGITLFGLRFREKKGAARSAGAKDPARSLKSYFLANNTIPWWAIALSIVSAETSTLTIISIPGVAFAGDFGFLQIVIGYMLGRIVVAMLFLPRYFEGSMMTAYQLIDQRFGPMLHKVTAGLFLLTRAAAEGVRVFAVSIVVGIAIGTRDVLSIAIISALTLLYTFEGGMAAVIWTDVVQMAIYVGGTLVAIWSIGHHIPGGWSTIHAIAAPDGKFHMFNFALNLTTTYTFWAGILGGTFLTMASHGTDQLMVQRMLAARNLRESRLALLSSGVVIFIQFTLFLLIGVGLWVYSYAFRKGGDCGGNCTASHIAITYPVALSPDRIFPTFIVHEMPIGIAGLLVAAILAAAMSNLSAALNSLSSTTVVDFYMHLRPHADDRERTIISKSSTILWALVLFAIAVATVSVGGRGHVVEIGLSIASVAYGCLLGVFLLGTLTKFATQTGATIGMVCGFVLNLWLWQGTFPVHLGPLTIPHVAFTWYVIIGALVTFAIGALFSLIFRKQARRTPTIITASILLFLLSFPQGTCFSQTPAQRSGGPSIAPASGAMGGGPQTPDFTPITTLLNDAIAAHKLPGAVVLIGHNGKVVFEHAYGDRKLAGEPGLDGKPSPAEPMTEDTLFDMASLTKCLATATAVMQLYEAGKITSFDDPVEKYLPAFNPSHDPERAKVTLRMLLTHTSGEAPDVDLKDAWGLAKPDKAEGFRRALTTPLKAVPGSHFEYSDINFILLGDLVETLSGLALDEYAKQSIFWPLHMGSTSYHSYAETCEPKPMIGSAFQYVPMHVEKLRPGSRGHIKDLNGGPCDDWRPLTTIPNTAPTAHDNEGTAVTNPDFDRLLRGTVHDPTTRRMGGVAGHAGVFSTAHDISLFAQALLDKLTKNTGPFPLKQSTLQLMTSPEQPGRSPFLITGATDRYAECRKRESTLDEAELDRRCGREPGTLTSPGAPHLASEMWVSTDVTAANKAQAASIAAGDKPAAPGLAPHYPALKDQSLRGFGWDIDTAFSKPRGAIFPIGSFGHTGFTGTSLWMDPASNTYVILLANSIHPRGNPPISNLRGQLASLAAQAIGLGEIAYQPEDCDGKPDGPPVTVEQKAAIDLYCSTSGATDCPGVMVCATYATRTGIDVLKAGNFEALKNLRRIGLLTNQSGIDAQGHRTIDILHSLTTYNLQLTTLFSPEHGVTGTLDTEKISSTEDPTTHLPIISLYGAHESDRRPTHAQLKDLDAVIIDLQDAGVRFWTYEAAMSYFLGAAAKEKTDFHHHMEVVILDRPNLVGGMQTQGPLSDPGSESYVNTMPLPVRHGLTFGELARYYVATHHLATHLTVIPMQHWSRTQTFADTGLPWVNPSPNLRSPEAAMIYPALGLIEFANISVGRGTDHPFSFFGAAWMNATDVAAALTARHIPGVTFTAGTEAIAEDANHYPFHGQTIPTVRVTLTDPASVDTPELGIEILAVLHRLYPTQFKLAKVEPLLCNQATLDALTRGDDPRDIAATWVASLQAFRTAAKPFLLYP